MSLLWNVKQLKAATQTLHLVLNFIAIANELLGLGMSTSVQWQITDILANLIHVTTYVITITNTATAWEFEVISADLTQSESLLLGNTRRNGSLNFISI